MLGSPVCISVSEYVRSYAEGPTSEAFDEVAETSAEIEEVLVAVVRVDRERGGEDVVVTPDYCI